MKVRIQIETTTFIRFWLVLAGFVLAALMIYSARTGLILVGTALFLALALNGPVTRIAKYLPGEGRVMSTAISYFLVVAFISTFLFLALPPIVQQTAKFAQTVPALVENATSNWKSLDHAIQEYNLQPQVDSALASLKENATTYASNVGSNLISGVGSVFGFFVSGFLVLVLTFLMLIEGPMWMSRLLGLYRDKEKMETHHKIFVRMAGVVSGYVTGQLTVSGIGAVFAGLAAFIISLLTPEMPSSLAIPVAAITFIFTLIPMFGSTIAAVLVAVLIGLNSWVAAIAYVIYFLIYQQIENNFISPVIQSKKLELSALIVLVAVTIGVYVFGIVGAIISIPIAGGLKVLVEEYFEHAKKKHKKAEKPLRKLAKKVEET